MSLMLARNLSAVVLFVVSGAAYAAPTYAPACLSASSDNTGDGWGWENDGSCVITNAVSSGTQLVCRPGTIDPDGDGWEFQRGDSCIVIKPAVVVKPPPVERAVCEYLSSDLDGDGWGFENGASCLIDETSKGEDPDVGKPPVVVVTNPSSSKPICESAASDMDNDGWGYENGKSCRVSDIPKSDRQTFSRPSVNGKPVCASSLSDSDNDGYGFEGGGSCVVTADSRPFPVCLSLHSDFDGNGFGFENRTSCIVAEGVSHSRYDPLLATSICDSWIELAYGNYRLENNTWNATVMDSTDWSQCIRLDKKGNRTVASWTFDWLDKLDGDLDSVKSYPQVYYGRKTERSFSGTYEELGLPELVYGLPEFTVDYHWSITGDAENNVALESFFHTSCDTSHKNKEFEMMIWVGRPKTKSPGVYLGVATIDDRRWEVYANPYLTWGYISFVAEENIYKGRLNWNRFVEWSRDNAENYGTSKLRSDACMGAIEIGTETFWGAGEFTLHQFDVNRVQ